MAIASAVGEKLKRIRELKCMTQKQVSIKSGVSQSQISMIESGKSNVGVNTLELLADALGVELSVLDSEDEIDLVFYL